MCEKCDADRGFLPLTRDQTRHRRNPEQRRQVLIEAFVSRPSSTRMAQLSSQTREVLGNLSDHLIKGFETSGMSNEEIAYWLPLLTGLVRGVEVPGLILDAELRPFIYAVPLQGLSVEGQVKSFHVKDFGVISGEDDVFAPLLTRSQLAKEHETVWQANTPKAWGIVAARDFLEAERKALSRARFTADLINFALSTGISHFQTRYEAGLLDWNADVGRSVISLQPWIMLRETKVAKGWIRAVPFIERRSEIDLEDGYERIKFFADRFIKASRAGDAKDQAGRRTLSERERKLSAGIQRSLRWLAVAANENSDVDQFIAAWIALESVLSSIDYPGVFEGDRRAVRNTIKLKASRQWSSQKLTSY